MKARVVIYNFNGEEFIWWTYLKLLTKVTEKKISWKINHWCQLLNVELFIYHLTSKESIESQKHTFDKPPEKSTKEKSDLWLIN